MGVLTKDQARAYAQAAIREVLVGERRRLGLQPGVVAELEATVVGRMQRLMETVSPKEVGRRLELTASRDDEPYLRLRG